jgi:sec-independent protein translocase protein TatC
MSEIINHSSDEEQTAVDTLDIKMSLVDHLQELRKRLLVVVIAVVIGSTVCYFYSTELVHFITAPAGKLYLCRVLIGIAHRTLPGMGICSASTEH